MRTTKRDACLTVENQSQRKLLGLHQKLFNYTGSQPWEYGGCTLCGLYFQSCLLCASSSCPCLSCFIFPILLTEELASDACTNHRCASKKGVDKYYSDMSFGKACRLPSVTLAADVVKASQCLKVASSRCFHMKIMFRNHVVANDFPDFFEVMCSDMIVG